MEKENLAVTHDGVFHGDEIVSTIILINTKHNFKIIRTRNPEIIEKALIVYDVGGKYDGEKYFDHHQKDSPIRENGKAYSSAGLVWKTFGEEVILNLYPELAKEEVERIFKTMDEKFILPFDLIDNGEINIPENTLTMSNFISSFNPNWLDDNNNSDRQFWIAVNLTQEFFYNYLHNTIVDSKAENIVLEKYKNSTDKQILIFNKFVPTNDTIFDHNLEEVLFVIYPNQNNDWMLKCIAPSKTEQMKQRFALPEKWAGLRDKDLQEITKVDDAIFCHTGRFIAGAKSKEGALALAYKTLRI